MMPMTIERMKTAMVSNELHLKKGRRGLVAQSTMTGAMTKEAAASASHQVAPVPTEPAKPLFSPRMKAPIATAELIIAVGTKEMSANFAMPAGVSNVLRPFDQRPIIHAPANPASRDPIPTEVDAKTECPCMS